MILQKLQRNIFIIQCIKYLVKILNIQPVQGPYKYPINISFLHICLIWTNLQWFGDLKSQFLKQRFFLNFTITWVYLTRVQHICSKLCQNQNLNFFSIYINRVFFRNLATEIVFTKYDPVFSVLRSDLDTKLLIISLYLNIT